MAVALEIAPAEQATFVRAARGEITSARLHRPAQAPRIALFVLQHPASTFETRERIGRLCQARR